MNETCTFPFEFEGVQYNECIPIEPNGQFFCPTSNSGTLEGDKYGRCNVSACPFKGRDVELSSK